MLRPFRVTIRVISYWQLLKLWEKIRKARFILGPLDLFLSPTLQDPDAYYVLSLLGHLRFFWQGAKFSAKAMTLSFRDLRQEWRGRAGHGRRLPSFPNLSLALKNTSCWTVSHPQENVTPKWSPEPCHDWPKGRWFPFSLYFWLFPWGKTWLILFTTLITSRSLSGDMARLFGGYVDSR